MTRNATKVTTKRHEAGHYFVFVDGAEVGDVRDVRDEPGIDGGGWIFSPSADRRDLCAFWSPTKREALATLRRHWR